MEIQRLADRNCQPLTLPFDGVKPAPAKAEMKDPLWRRRA